jgi:hypothetical protein
MLVNYTKCAILAPLAPRNARRRISVKHGRTALPACRRTCEASGTELRMEKGIGEEGARNGPEETSQVLGMEVLG